MKLVFLGTPEFGKIVLEYILKSKHQVVGVVCQVDKPNKRGNKIEKCAVKDFAEKQNLNIYQFENIKNEVDTLKSLNADIFVTAAYGQILSQEIIDLPKYSIINAHGSLLPKYRGASPVQYAILNGEKETGITIMKTVFKMDAGDIILAEKVAIDREDNTESLMKKLAHIAGKLVVKVLDDIEDGKAVYTSQDENLATFTKMLKKENSYLDFSDSAINLENKIKAYNPNPVARFKINNSEYKVYSAFAEEVEVEGAIGEIVECSVKTGFKIKTGKGVLSIKEIQAENSKRLKINDFLNGTKLTKGSKCN